MSLEILYLLDIKYKILGVKGDMNNTHTGRWTKILKTWRIFIIHHFIYLSLLFFLFSPFLSITLMVRSKENSSYMLKFRNFLIYLRKSSTLNIFFKYSKITPTIKHKDLESVWIIQIIILYHLIFFNIFK